MWTMPELYCCKTIVVNHCHVSVVVEFDVQSLAPLLSLSGPHISPVSFICRVRLREPKNLLCHHWILRSVRWEGVSTGTFSICCNSLIRRRKWIILHKYSWWLQIKFCASAQERILACAIECDLFCTYCVPIFYQIFHTLGYPRCLWVYLFPVICCRTSVCLWRMLV